MNVVAANDGPTLTASITGTSYASVGEFIRLDEAFRVTDVDSVDFNGGALTVALSNNGMLGDVLGFEIKAQA